MNTSPNVSPIIPTENWAPCQYFSSEYLSTGPLATNTSDPCKQVDPSLQPRPAGLTAAECGDPGQGP